MRARDWRADAARGVATGLVLWGLEATVVSVGGAGIGGWSVLAATLPRLCAWGLGYAAFGLLSGLVHRFGPALGWVVVWGMADRGVLPGALHLGVVALACGLGSLAAIRPSWTERAAGGAVGVLVLLAGLGALPEAAPSGRGEGPDVLLVVIDTLRADHVGAHGYGRPTTPNLDRLAQQGVRYAQARATSSWTLPSHASLFTGQLPSAHGAVEGRPELSPDAVTIAEQLAGRGWATVGFSANAWVSAGTGLDQGFQRFRFVGDEGLVSQLLLPLAFDRPVDLGGRAVADGVIDALDRAQGPVFAFANLLEAHEPLGSVPEPWLSKFSADTLDPTLGRTWIRDMPRFWCTCREASAELECREGLFRADETRIRGVVDRYDAGLAYADHQLGRMLEALDRRGRPSIVVVTSDHGELLGEGGRLGHMVWLEDVLLDVPLVVRAPGLLPSVDRDPISLADVPGLVLARVDGREPPARTAPIAESHPHGERTLVMWEAAWQCDFTPARLPRRSLRVDGRHLRWQAGRVDAEDGQPVGRVPASLSGPFADGGAGFEPSAALEALGYVTP